MNTNFDHICGNEPLHTALCVLSGGLATLEQVADAVIARSTQRPALGQLMLRKQLLTMHEVFQVLNEQAVSTKRFGEIAVDMGLVSEKQVDEMLELQHSLCPPLVDVLVARQVITPSQAAEVARGSLLPEPTLLGCD